jgi:hypothetical protein
MARIDVRSGSLRRSVGFCTSLNCAFEPSTAHKKSLQIGDWVVRVDDRPVVRGKDLRRADVFFASSLRRDAFGLVVSRARQTLEFSAFGGNRSGFQARRQDSNSRLSRTGHFSCAFDMRERA